MSIFSKCLIVGFVLLAAACGGSEKSEASDTIASVSINELAFVKTCEVPEDISELSFEGNGIYYSGSSEILEGRGCSEIELIEVWDDAACAGKDLEFLMLDVRAVSDIKAEITTCGTQ